MSDFVRLADVRLQKARPGLVPEDRGEDPPLFDCPVCLDLGFMHRDDHQGSYAKPCDCQLGDQIEGARWFDRLYPPRDGKRRIDEGERAKLRSLVVAGQDGAERIQSVVSEMLKRYNDRLKRRLQEDGR